MRHIRESLARGIARVSRRAPGCQRFPTNGRKVPQAGEAGLAARGSESPSGRESRSAHCGLVWRRRSPARLGRDGQEAETQGTEGRTQRQGPRRRGGAERKGSPRPQDRQNDRDNRRQLRRKRKRKGDGSARQPARRPSPTTAAGLVPKLPARSSAEHLPPAAPPADGKAEPMSSRVWALPHQNRLPLVGPVAGAGCYYDGAGWCWAGMRGGYEWESRDLTSFQPMEKPRDPNSPKGSNSQSPRPLRHSRVPRPVPTPPGPAAPAAPAPNTYPFIL